MPKLGDRAAIRRILETDRPWAAYALGDLSPGFFSDCEWNGADPPSPALVLLYRGFETPVLFAMGAPERECAAYPKVILSIRPEMLPVLEERYQITRRVPMWRMLLDPRRFTPAQGGGGVRLGPTDLPALERLYADGQAAGEAPDAFAPAMLESGVFFGARAASGELVSAAGTHLVVPAEGVAAIGNVYTRRDHRGRGLATGVTGAVAAALLAAGLRTVVLNVAQANAAAVRAYEKVGFERYCAHVEGMAALR